MKAATWIFSCFSCIHLCTHASFGLDLEAQKKGLDIIGEFADKICSDIPLYFNSHTLELTGKGNAELKGVFKKIAGLGIEGAVKYKESESHGLVQTDLAKALKTSSDCKQRIWSDLNGKLLPVEAGKSGKYRIKVSGTPKGNGQVPGLTLDLYVDGRNVGRFSNLADPNEIDLGDLDGGEHRFRFENISEFSVNTSDVAAGAPKASSLNCEGRFTVDRSRTFGIVARIDQGIYTCDLK